MLHCCLILNGFLTESRAWLIFSHQSFALDLWLYEMICSGVKGRLSLVMMQFDKSKVQQSSHYSTNQTRDYRNPRPIVMNSVKTVLQINIYSIFPILETRYRESGWPSGHQSCLPPLRTGIEYRARHVGWDLSISIWLWGFFSGYTGFPPSANLTFTPRSEPWSD
mgnify:CR=1 FL=1